MKKLIKIKTVCLLCSVFLLSCSEKELPDTIKIDRNVENILLPEIVDSVTVIPLETTDECLIGYISGIQYLNGHYHMYDHQNMSIFTFDEKGKFVKKFRKHGQGPGEYLSVAGFRFDADGFLHLLDLAGRKILKYDYKTDSMLANIKIDRDIPRDFTCLENKYLLYMRDGKAVRQGVYTFDPDEQNPRQNG
jgi:hypothetical protein